LELNSLSLTGSVENEEEQSPMQKRYHELLQLEQQREQAMLAMKKRQQVVKIYFDKSTTSKYFQKDELTFVMEQSKGKTIFPHKI
jgi:hypothetical protein